MGLRFRRSIRIASWLRLNIGKRGVSTSIGSRGFRVTLGHGKVRQTIGLPGSGLSYSHIDKTAANVQGAARVPAVPKHRHIVGLVVLALLAWAFVHLLLTRGGLT